MKKSVTIPKDEFLFYDTVIREEQKLDDFSFNEVIEKYYAYFENDIEILIEIVNDYRPHLRATLRQNRKNIQKQNYYYNLPESFCFKFQDREYVVCLTPY